MSQITNVSSGSSGVVDFFMLLSLFFDIFLFFAFFLGP